MSHSGQVVIINATTGGVAAADMVLMSYSLDDATQALTLTVGDGTNSVDIGPIDFTAAINTATQGQLGVTSATVDDATQTVTITMNDGSTADVDMTAAINSALATYLAANSDVSLTNNGNNTFTFSNGVDADVTFVSSVGTLVDNGDGTATFSNGVNPDVTITLGGPTATDTNMLTDSLTSDGNQVQDFAGFNQVWNNISGLDVNVVGGIANIGVASAFFSGTGQLDVGAGHGRVVGTGTNPGQGTGTAQGTTTGAAIVFEHGGNEAAFSIGNGGVGPALGVPQTHMRSQAVESSSATVGQVATLMNAGTGEVEFQNAGSSPVISVASTNGVTPLDSAVHNNAELQMVADNGHFAMVSGLWNDGDWVTVCNHNDFNITADIELLGFASVTLNKGVRIDVPTGKVGVGTSGSTYMIRISEVGGNKHANVYDTSYYVQALLGNMTRLAASNTPVHVSSAGNLVTRVIEQNNTTNVAPDGSVSSHYRCGGAGSTNTTIVNPVGYGAYDKLLIEIRNAASVPSTFDFGSDYFYNDGVAVGSITLQPSEVFSGEFQYSQQNSTPTPWRAISINRRPAAGGLTIADMPLRETFDRELYVSSSGEVKSRVIMNVGINGNIVPNGANSSHYRLQRNVLSGASNIEASTGYPVYSELTFDLVANGAGSASFTFNAEYVYADGTPVGTLTVPIGAATQVNFVRDTFGWRVLNISRGSNGAAGAASNGGTAIFTSTVTNGDKPTQAEFNGVFQAGISTIDLDLSGFTSSGVIEIRPTMNGAFNVVGAWSAGAYNDEFGSGNLNGATYLAGQVYQMRVLFSGTDPYVFIVKLT